MIVLIESNQTPWAFANPGPLIPNPKDWSNSLRFKFQSNDCQRSKSVWGDVEQPNHRCYMVGPIVNRLAVSNFQTFRLQRNRWRKFSRFAAKRRVKLQESSRANRLIRVINHSVLHLFQNLHKTSWKKISHFAISPFGSILNLTYYYLN